MTARGDAPTGLAARLVRVRERIGEAADASGRDPSSITTIVVTKFHPVSLIRELVAEGVRDVGENRHQEAQSKADELADLPLVWHFVGQLQTKKARQARRYASVVHSVDRIALVDALSSEEADIDCFVQVNLTDDPARGGIAPAELDALVEHVVSAPGVRLLGLMAVAPLGAPPRPEFARLRGLRDRVTAIAPGARALSMGMSDDFEDAILEGATHLRIGTAITGDRPTAG